ncbi:hypothetical protein WR164_09510 [Philodulcilactobacillus myokoensis]|uniref:Lipopolysaccharide assembly protein A domain-containing protein n=1 Tax=Philodulcilactobacillus myokoensis TaxID=2929573 RepID=A0A9W6ESZ4_9LACO|nr:LapA family protein [Philodulcilactobacillus myokoensis]GLB46972.1 hypothetical protein WR164_09510 [Philodulcilactobacillus myokoensis]
MKRQIQMITLIILLILIAIFALLNMGTVSIHFGFSVVNIPLVLLLFISILLGMIINFLLSTINTFKQNSKYNQLKRKKNQEVKDLNQKIEHLNNQLVNKGKQIRK